LRRLAQDGSTVAGSRTAGEYFSRMAKSSFAWTGFVM